MGPGSEWAAYLGGAAGGGPPDGSAERASKQGERGAKRRLSAAWCGQAELLTAEKRQASMERITMLALAQAKAAAARGNASPDEFPNF